MFSDFYTLPMASNGPSPIITFIPSSRFDDKGRQMQFVESDIQRQERLAFLKISKATKQAGWASLSEPSSGRTSPTSSIRSMRSASSSSSSLSSSPTNSPFSDVLDIPNTCPEPFLFYSSPLPSSGSASPSMSLFSPAPLPPSTTSAAGAGSFKRSHRRQSSSLHGLHAIPEED
ncbi:hypothetical protein DFP72DRAFT_852470 [Ephemerocybe angulata]|uniref:Uncharacterized protein n=1 Tax=Ephemerocybe angulata TaxID=980116 RepID=A0A8H6HM88_9AGAR|nr:hypothetical protein DFP72DRAFT_852470 [Tulosesus angulatus]